MTQYKDFPSNHLATLQADIRAAMQLAAKAANVLTLSPNGPSQKIMKLLYLSFHIEVSTWSTNRGAELVTPIRNKLSTFPERIQRTTFRYVKEGREGHPAYVEPSVRDTIHISEKYFGVANRAPLLVHEVIHLHNISFGLQDQQHAHPGGVVMSFGDAPMGIPYEQAVRNPYCYQHFVSGV